MQKPGRGAGICEAMQDISVQNTSSILSWHSFIVPTTEWFVSVHDFELCQDGNWITSARVPLFPYNVATLQTPDCATGSQDGGSEQDNPFQFLHANSSSIWVDGAMYAVFSYT